MRPLIGIPPCLDATGRWRKGRDYHYIHDAYARAVDAAGALAVYLPVQGDPSALVERIDGLLLPGGGDFAPPRPYPGDVVFDLVPERQLEFDRALLASALARDVPVLGICYGMQLLALHQGGTIHFEIGVDVPGADPHQLDEATGRHALAVTPDSQLASILGAGPGRVNSLHHQAVAEPGRDVLVCAHASDGVIEAIEVEGKRFAIGVQWHPENMEAPHRQALFGAFTRACEAKQCSGDVIPVLP